MDLGFLGGVLVILASFFFFFDGFLGSVLRTSVFFF